jgi:hypothetical protein
MLPAHEELKQRIEGFAKPALPFGTGGNSVARTFPNELFCAFEGES